MFLSIGEDEGRKCPTKECVTWKLEAMAIYSEAIAMVEEYEQGLNNSLLQWDSDLYETLEHRMTIAEAAQRLRASSYLQGW
ncbi:hypothetical protein GBA52_014351 [Prunus armeniaca]|nr:hypothetical protein GBA52_014351 [Prunus armeniaca]